MQQPVPLVGRIREIDALTALLPRPPAFGGRSALVLGEAGIGKSGLVREVGRRARAAGTTVLYGRNTAAAGGTRCRAYVEALSACSRLAGVPDAPELEAFRPVLGHLLPEWAQYATEGAAEQPMTLAESILRLLVTVAGGSGCLLVLEDLQYADETTLAVTDYLLDNLEGVPVSIIATARPDAGAAVALARSASMRRVARAVDLDALPPSEVAELAARRLGVPVEEVPATVLARLHADGEGNPFVVEELLQAMVAAGVLARQGSGWSAVDGARAPLSATLVASITERAGLLPAMARDTLVAGALFGRQFHALVLAAALGVPPSTLDADLRAAVDHRFVRMDNLRPHWYAFRPALTPAALLTPLTAAQRQDLATQLADTAEEQGGELPDGWRTEVAALRLAAGSRSAAARLLAADGRAALDRGAARVAVGALERAWDLTAAEAPETRAEVLDPLLVALIEAGEPARALALEDAVTGLSDVVPAEQLATLHARLARAAGLAGRFRYALTRIRLGRGLLDPGATGDAAVALDLAEAQLLQDLPAALAAAPADDRLAELQARMHDTPLAPDQACAALEMQAAAAAPADAREQLRAMLDQAERHGLPGWRARALAMLGAEHAWHHGTADRLVAARTEAAQLGRLSVTSALETNGALLAALHGDHAWAMSLVDSCRADADRFGHRRATGYAALAAAVSAAHRGKRPEMNLHLERFRDGGVAAGHLSTGVGLAEVFCTLLEEDHTGAEALLGRAAELELTHPYAYSLAGTHGVALLLRAVRRDLTWPQYREASAAPQADLRWNAQFRVAARAVLLGHDGYLDAAEEAAREALRLARPFPLARHLILRLAGPAAVAQGWPHAAAGLRVAEDWFRDAGHTAVAGACRALVRSAGGRVRQRRRGSELIPHGLREAGVTAREFEVLVLLGGRMRNAEIGARLYISARTVEKHVTNLLAKVGKSSRHDLVELATATGVVS